MSWWPFKKHACATQGHRMRLETRMGFIVQHGGLHYRCVADDVEQRRGVCRHCDLATPWETTYSSCLQGLTMDNDRWRKLREEGFIRS